MSIGGQSPIPNSITKSARARYTQKFDRLSDVLIKATRAEDIKKAKKGDKHAVLYNFQNTLLIGYETDQLDFWYARARPQKRPLRSAIQAAEVCTTMIVVRLMKR